MQRFFIAVILWLCLDAYLSIAEADQPPAIKTEFLERQIHRQINLERKKYKLPELDRDEQLIAIARNHSNDMANRHFFNHTNRQGERPSDRARRQGWSKKKHTGPHTLMYGVAENIYLARLYDNIVTIKQNGRIVKKTYQWTKPDQLIRTIVQGWMNSPPHRKIILSPRYDREGIGVFISGNDAYVTQNLF
ncbi:MAG: CAP domain-containing protein [Gammaproteobacteria bacterium]